MSIKIKKQTNLKSRLAQCTLLFTLTVLSGFGSVSAQKSDTALDIPIPNSFENYKKLPLPGFAKIEQFSTRDIKFSSSAFARVATENAPIIKDSLKWETDVEDVPIEKSISQIKDKEKFHWKPALLQSGIFLGIQHGFRMKQEKTRRELGGPFSRDWANSVKNLRGWKDGDSSFTNYVAHPLQGGLTGRIFINNSDRAKKQVFGNSREYWATRFKAMAWSAAWSTQFELGPLSESSIGNVGLRQRKGHSTMAYLDLVITPTVGTGVLIGEDAIDKYVLKNWLERKTGGRATIKIKILRSLLTPTTSISNLLRWKKPWKRDNR